MSDHYVILEHKHHGLQTIKLTAGPFSGIIYTYGKIQFQEDEQHDCVRLKFQYDIIDYADKVLHDAASFESYIGSILEELIYIGVKENSITYTGGIDENRAEDSNQSYTR
jgi:hypothetical protein